MNLTQGHIAKAKVTVHTFQIPCPDNNLLVLFHSIVVNDQGCAMTLTKGHISKVIIWIWIKFNTIVVLHVY